MNNLIQTNISTEFKKKLEQEKNNYVMARSATLQPGVVRNILKNIQEHCKLESAEEATAVLALLFQQGGTARSCDGNMSVIIFGKEIKLSNIRKILKQDSCNRGERKLARSLANKLYEISLVLELPGNLYNKIQKKRR